MCSLAKPDDMMRAESENGIRGSGWCKSDSVPEATDNYQPVSHFVLANTLATIGQDLEP